MTTLTMERPAIIRGEWNHSCTSQCANPCTVKGAVDVDLSPEMTDSES